MPNSKSQAGTKADSRTKDEAAQSVRHKWIDFSGVGYAMCMNCYKRRRSYFTKSGKKNYEYEELYGWSNVRPACS